MGDVLREAAIGLGVGGTVFLIAYLVILVMANVSGKPGVEHQNTVHRID